MQKKLRLFTTLFFTCLWAVTQAQSQQIGTPEQKTTAIQFMYFLEQDMQDNAISMIDGHKTIVNKTFKDKLKEATKQIAIAIKKADPGIIPVKEKEGTRYSYCYYNKELQFPEQYQADIFFFSDDATKISKVIFYTPEELKKKRIEREKSASKIKS
ncbi:hypothetical protein [Chitinophaga flava]|uniref:DUF3887 domain-containing protein n=1 Tax=Chitinophaga flava TaxID=2259036 RepID=A0A365Y4B9_9BACT|nr:hypothetical protein [Chitinophaga flava]RBL93168.1 hypothetical protein DF182_11520 [Chitinophaga flava]